MTGNGGPVLLVAVLLAAAVLTLGGFGRGSPAGSGGHGGSGGSGPARPRRRRPRSRAPVPADVALLLDLVAAALTSGLPPAAAVAEASAAIRHAAATRPDDAHRAGFGTAGLDDLDRACARVSLGADPATAWRAAGPRWVPLADALELAATSGAAPAELLRGEARRARRARRRSAEEAASRVGALLVLPLGLCSLPAFLLLAVVPVVLELAVGTWESLR